MSILLVDDDRKDVELVLAAFSEIDLDKRVTIACDGEEALDYIYKRRKYKGRANGAPRLIILDLKMPKVSGLEVLSTIRSDKKIKNIPVVILTSSGEVRDILKSYQLGVNAYVVKPLEFAQFFKTVKQIGRFWIYINETPSNPGTEKD